jgi:alanine-synthesizing transaminase
MAMQGLLNSGDEVLVPAPDYPLWTAAVTLAGGTAASLHLRRRCRLDARSGRHPRQDHAEHPRHRHHQPEQPDRCALPDALLLDLVEIAREHNLIVFADEIYDKVLYDGATHTSIASLADDCCSSPSTACRRITAACGYRAGWMVVSGDKRMRATTSTA